MTVMGPCKIWTGCINRKGYGMRRVGGRKGKTWLVHRLAWTEVHGDPGDLCVLHLCDTPACYNVEHLFLGTRADNNNDMAAKGRHGRWQSRKTHCPRGHEYDTIGSKGERGCKRCHADAQLRYRRRQPSLS